MKKPLISILIFFLSITTFSQKIHINGEVIDINSGKPLPYSNIMVLNHAVGTTADKNGKFNLSLNDSLTNSFLIVSYVGYKSEKIKIRSNDYLRVNLTPENIMISEVIVQPSKKSRSVVLNDFKKSHCVLRFSIAQFDSSGQLNVPYRPSEPTIEAIYFKASQEYENRQVKSVRLALRNFRLNESVFSLRILEPNQNQEPGEDLISSPIIISYKGEKELIVDLEDYNLHLTDNGIFIGVELFILPENKCSIFNESNTEAVLYSPFLYVLETDTQGGYWVYSKGKWHESKYWYYKEGIWFESEDKNITSKNTTKPLLFKPAISLILK